VLAVKANQPALLAGAEAAIAAVQYKPRVSAKTARTARGRKESRAALVAI
jgi:hypothetical protein